MGTCFWHLGLADKQDAVGLSNGHVSSQEKGHGTRLKTKPSPKSAFTHSPRRRSQPAAGQAHETFPLWPQFIQPAGSPSRRCWIMAGRLPFPAGERREYHLVLNIRQRSCPGVKEGISLPPKEIRIQETRVNTQLKKTGPGRGKAEERRE